MGTKRKGKRSKTSSEPAEEDGNEHFDKELILSIEKLQEIQDELDKVNEEAIEKVLEVEQKYNEIRRPVYVKRNKIIQKISDFWTTAFMNHPAICNLLSKDDQKIFKYLKSLDVDDCKDAKSGYTITFTFSFNPYFEDTQISKTCSFDDEGVPTISATNIKWKDGRDIVNGVDNEKEGNKQMLSEEHSCSFFTWFSETQQENCLLEELHDEVAEIIREDLWTNPLKYFNNGKRNK